MPPTTHPTQPVAPVDEPERKASSSGRLESSHESTSAKEPEKELESKKESQGGFSAADLWKEGTKVLSAAGDGLLRNLGFASKDDMLPAYDEATLSKVQKAVKGNDMAAMNEKSFMDMKGPYQQKTFQEGDFKNIKDASVKLNDKGQVTDFTTAPAQAHGEGFSYKNIKYDDKGAVKSFDTPWNTTISRISEPDANGYARWQNTNKQGQLVNYSGADSAVWQGKTVIDEHGIHNIVASGPKQWNTYSRDFDGTHSETHPQVEKGTLKGFETTTTLPDNTKLTTKSHFEKGQVVRNPSVDLTEPNGEKSSVELDTAKQHHKFVSPEERKRIEAFSSMMDFDSNPMFNHVNSFKMNRNGNNLNFAADLDRPLNSPPPNVRITGLGPFGGASAVPISSRINDPSGTIVTHPENPGQVDIVNMHGFSGESQAYGPRGRPRGVHSSETHSMTMYSDQNGNGHLVARSDKAAVNLTANNMRGGMFGDVLADSAKRKEFTDSLAKIRDNLDSLEFTRDAKGNLHGSVDPRVSEMPINKKIGMGLEATNLYFADGKLGFDVQKTAGGKDFTFKEGDLKVGVKGSKSEEMKLSVSKVITTKDADGKPHAEVEFYGWPTRAKLF